MKEDIIDIIKVYGWTGIKSKNPYMYSFMNGDKRLNYYFTTGTITIQSPTMAIVSLKNATLDKVEDLLSK